MQRQLKAQPYLLLPCNWTHIFVFGSYVFLRFFSWYLPVVPKTVEQRVHYEICHLEKDDIDTDVHKVLVLPLSKHCAGKVGQKRIVSLPSPCKSDFQDRVRAGILRQLITCILFFPHQEVIVSHSL